VSAVGPGLYDIYKSPYLNTTSATVSGLPTNGAKVYVRLFSSVNGVWQSVDYTYTAYAAPAGLTFVQIPDITLNGLGQTIAPIDLTNHIQGGTAPFAFTITSQTSSDNAESRLSKLGQGFKWRFCSFSA
jgi:hypothetical protein